jgi:hypothetical protein
LLAKELLIDPDQVAFELVDEQEETYKVAVLSKTGELLLQDTFLVPVVAMPYINSGKTVYPTTGCVEIYKDGKDFKRQLMPTDRERFWLFFMSEVLDSLPDGLPINKPDRGYKYPLFSRIEVTVQMSEEERKLGIEEERHSPLEALHEDLYFNILDYFHYLGIEKNGKPMTSPGGVHPFMHVMPGISPKASIKVYGWEPVEKFVRQTQALTFVGESNEPISCKIRQNGMYMTLDRSEWRDLPTASVKGLTSEAASIWLGGVSYEGRAISVIDIYAPTEADFVSTHKLAYYKPTILIETGHHPNEVSSMPAILGLVNSLDPSLLNKVNLVIIPCANPDGAALHRRLTEDNPEWKHHAARYNAVGLEYAHHRYEETIFGEAEVVPKIFNRWLPDVSVDDHGIPSHEWVQPFAGYNSPPRFPVSYWIPNSLIYGIGKEMEGETYKEHRRLLKEMIENITAKVSQNQRVRLQNEHWARSYYKYGSRWLPNIFPIEQSDGMIFYKWETKVNPGSDEMIARYPEWCSIELISETSDETVYGEALEHCILAHQLFDLSVIETVAHWNNERSVSFKEGHLSYKRLRTLQL